MDGSGSSVMADLIYLDPPFCTGRHFGPFDDREKFESYLRDLTFTLTLLHGRIRPTGSLWLHCDHHASHYLKFQLDRIFGRDCFRNEVVWRYRRWPAKAHQLQRMHDVLLWYSARPEGWTFHELHGYESLAPSTLKTFGTKKQRADFSSGHRKPGTVDEETDGPPLSDVWDIGVIAPIAKERTGYPTQKPEALLERVILCSSNPGDLVLDPMCGSGTTLVVAKKLGRRAIGVDCSSEAIAVTQKRLAGMTL